MTEQPNEKLSQTWEEVLPRAWCVDNLLSREECQFLIRQAKDEGIEQKEFECDLRHRQRVQVRMEQPEISQALWERIKDHIPQEIVIDESTKGHNETGLLKPFECVGRWTPSKVSTRVHVAYCTGLGHLAAHRDGESVLGEHERSFITINGYLTDRPIGQGGATRFLRDDVTSSDVFVDVDESRDVRCRVESDKAGKAVVFFHALLHDGEPLMKGSEPKWVYRTLLYYKRDPETAPKLSNDEIEARRLVKEAEVAECSGSIMEAIKLYKRAYRLDPSLDR